MSKQWVALIFFISMVAQGGEAPLCPEAARSPMFRLNIAKSKVDERLSDIIFALKPKIQRDLKSLKIPDFIIKGPPGTTCDESRFRPSYDKDTRCLYMIASLVDWELPGLTLDEFYNQRRDPNSGFWGGIKNSLGFSIPSHMKFVDVEIKDFSMGEFELDCTWQETQQFCEIKVQLLRFEMETVMELRSPDDNRLLLRTIQPQVVLVEPTDAEPVFINFKAEILLDKVGRESVHIVRDSFQANIPVGVGRTPNHGRTTNIDKLIEIYTVDQVYRDYFLGADFPVNAPIEDQLAYIRENKERIGEDNSESVLGRVEERIVNDFSKIQMVREMADSFEVDILQVFGNQLWTAIQPGLSKKITKIVEDKIPFEEEVVTFLPFRRFNDLAWEEKNLDQLRSHISAIRQLALDLDSASDWNKAAKILKKANKYITKKLDKPLKYVGDSSSGMIKSVLRVLSLILEFYDEFITQAAERHKLYDDEPKDRRELKKFNRKKQKIINAKKVVVDAIQRVARQIERIEANIHSEEKELRLRVHSVSRAQDHDKINVQIAGCMPRVDEYPENVSFTEPVPRAEVQDYETAFQVPVTLMNEYLKVLHSEDYFSTCIGAFGMHCKAINRKFLLKWILPKKSRQPITPPQIVKHKDGRWVLRVKKFKFTERIPIVGSGKAFVDVDLNQALGPDGILFDHDSVSAQVGLIPDMDIRSVTSVAMNEEAVGMIQALNALDFLKSMWVSVAFHVAKFVVFNFTIESMERRGLLSQVINCGLEESPLVSLKQIKVTDDGFITFYGDFKEGQEFEESEACKHDYL